MSEAEDYMVAGQGGWRPPSTHRRLKMLTVLKFPPNPRHWTQEVSTVFSRQDKITVSSPETPYQKHVRLQRKGAMSQTHRDRHIFKPSSLADPSEENRREAEKGARLKLKESRLKGAYTSMRKKEGWLRPSTAGISGSMPFPPVSESSL